MLVNADFKFAPAVDSKGKKIDVTQGNFYSTLLGTPRPQSARALLKVITTSTSNSRIRLPPTSPTPSARMCSTCARANSRPPFRLRSSITTFPEEVFHNLINTFKKKLPVWHRYFEIRRKALKLKEIQYFDMWAPIAKKKTQVSYEKAVDLISDSLAPLGKDYVDHAASGLSQRPLGGLDCQPGQDERRVLVWRAQDSSLHYDVLHG
jgi:oligoendopeptidase F